MENRKLEAVKNFFINEIVYDAKLLLKLAIHSLGNLLMRIAWIICTILGTIFTSIFEILQAIFMVILQILRLFGGEALRVFLIGSNFVCIALLVVWFVVQSFFPFDISLTAARINIYVQIALFVFFAFAILPVMYHRGRLVSKENTETMSLLRNTAILVGYYAIASSVTSFAIYLACYFIFDV